MENKHLAIIAIIVVVIVAVIALVLSVGLLSVAPQNQTYQFDGCTLELPENVEFDNLTRGNASRVLEEFYYISDPNSGENYSFDVSKGASMISTVDQYVSNLAQKGATNDGNYNNWTIVNLHGYHPGGLRYNYLLLYHDGTVLYEFCGNNLTALEHVADTFRITS